jgi:hypothetical protein
LEWKSPSNCDFGIANLLIKLWNIEESRLGVLHSPDGSLLSTLDPLLGTAQASCDNHKSEDGRVIPEISENFRAKIYSIFSKLGFERSVYTLNTLENVKLVYISKYLDLKIGQVWEENYTELEADRMRPISPDQELFDQSRQHIQSKISLIKTRQLEFIQTDSTVILIFITLGSCTF